MTGAPKVQAFAPLTPLAGVINGTGGALTAAFQTAANLVTFVLPTEVVSASDAAKLLAVKVRVTTLAGGATQLILQLFEDANGDQPIIAQSSNTLTNAWTGLTTATSAQVVLRTDPALGFKIPSNRTLTLAVRTNAGTATMTAAEIVYEPN